MTGDDEAERVATVTAPVAGSVVAPDAPMAMPIPMRMEAGIASRKPSMR